VVTNKADTPAASKTVARNLVKAAGAAPAGKEGDRPNMDVVAVFIGGSLNLMLCGLPVLMTQTELDNRVYTNVVQLYIDDAIHSQW
jgi:hypothetical protein